MTNKSIPIKVDCPCGSNLITAKLITDRIDLSSLGILTILVDHINVTCPECYEHLEECDDDFSRTVGNLGL